MHHATGNPLQAATRAFSTRRVGAEALVAIETHDSTPPRAGDLVLARVDSLGQHTRLQRPSGRRKLLFPGDSIVVAYGNRYACGVFRAGDTVMHVSRGVSAMHPVRFRCGPSASTG